MEYREIEVIGVLAANPERIAEITAGASSSQLSASPAPGEWSCIDLLAHLRACSDVWGGCILRIVAEERPVFPRVSPRAWQRRAGFESLAFSESFEAYRQQRTELVDLLRRLTGEDWARAAVVKDGARTREWSVQYYAAWILKHEIEHMVQFEATAATVLR